LESRGVNEKQIIWFFKEILRAFGAIKIKKDNRNKKN
jgi:hypothetical protein